MDTPRTRNLTPNQLFALASAAIYLGAGVLGFLVTGFDDFAGDTDEKLVILGLNPLHNVVHLLLGATWLAMAFSRRWAVVTNLGLGVGLLLAFLLGVLGGAPFLNIDGASEPDNYLHLVYGAVAVAVALRAEARDRVLA